MSTQPGFRYRSFFWPALLVLAGVVALLVNTGVIAVERIPLLIDLWPLILIVIGLELILRRSVHGTIGDIAAALVVLLAIVGAGAYVTIAPNPSASHTMTSSAELGEIDQGSVEINVGSATINITSDTEVGADLYRAHIDYSGRQPDVHVDRAAGSLTISQSNDHVPFYQSTRFVLKLDLNPRIPWDIRQNSGAANDRIDLSNTHLTRLAINTGASREDITLGQPSALVPIDINGGALTVNFHRPSGVVAAVAVSGGAVTLNVDGRVQHAIGRATSAPPNPDAGPGYSIRVNGGACTVTLDSGAPSPTPGA